MRTVISQAYIANGGSIGSQPKDIVVEGARIVGIAAPGSVGSRIADRLIRADGRVLAPGFIDTHAHADNSPLLTEDDTSKILQGVTTEINGNCGFSLAPINAETEGDFTSLVERIFPPMTYGWDSFRSYVEALHRGEFITNFATLIGHNTIRIAAMGSENRPPAPAEMAMMEALIDEALELGAAGLSTGLIYPPGVFSSEEELIRLASRLPQGAVYASHMRNESRHLLASVEETIAVARQAGTRCHISHLKMADRRLPGQMTRVLEYIDDRNREGTPITQDVYPYTAASTMLSAILPPWMHDGGSQALRERLTSASLVSEAARQIHDPLADFENYGLQAGWENIVIASTASHRFEGESILAISRRLCLDPVAAVAAILSEENLAATMIVHAMREEDVQTVLRHPNTMVGTDGLPVGTGGRPHPRGYGSFPRILQKYVREMKTLSLPEALRRMTALPAEVFGLHGRGWIKEGYIADLVLFDPTGVVDNASYSEPTAAPQGIDDVIIGGERVVENGSWTGRRAGKFLAVNH
ncbi:N-acyl-D-amino-acid deacylase family protein [Corynebacterium pacaense]|uniref:N-acyl-D-amino-acid deacylase family protein n=1 Tax=Corynebacterium pacaense TaxID=1816684 RepID=UPI0009BAD4DC|nr:D-aminoacylase [Corynebacterium pacaense]